MEAPDTDQNELNTDIQFSTQSKCWFWLLDVDQYGICWCTKRDTDMTLPLDAKKKYKLWYIEKLTNTRFHCNWFNIIDFTNIAGTSNKTTMP